MSKKLYFIIPFLILVLVFGFGSACGETPTEVEEVIEEEIIEEEIVEEAEEIEEIDEEIEEPIKKEMIEESSEEDILNQIMEKAKQDWPNDSEMQEFQYNNQVEAYHEILNIPNTPDYREEILTKAKDDWHNDHEMQLFQYNNQLEAYHEIQNLPNTSTYHEEILTKAQGDWSNDYEMQLFQYDNQLEAYLEIQQLPYTNGYNETALNTKIITYITVDRPNGPGANIASDMLSLLPRHLDSIGNVQNISLFLYSLGGDVDVPWRMVTLIREYCKNFYVIVPYKAHSAATLICLGADEILMNKMSELSPIDPSVSNAFNPDDPKNPLKKIPISVEDVTSFIKLIKEEIEKEENIDKTSIICNIFQQLTNKIHPLALGNVQRSHIQIRELSKKLLRLHMKNKNEKESKKINKIVDILTEKLYSHRHLIPRYEAKHFIGLNVKYLEGYNENVIRDLYKIYEKKLDIGKIFNPIELLNGREKADLELKIALIETLNTNDTYFLNGTIYKPEKPGDKPKIEILEQGWKYIK